MPEVIGCLTRKESMVREKMKLINVEGVLDEKAWRELVEREQTYTKEGLKAHIQREHAPCIYPDVWLSGNRCSICHFKAMDEREKRNDASKGSEGGAR